MARKLILKSPAFLCRAFLNDRTSLSSLKQPGLDFFDTRNFTITLYFPINNNCRGHHYPPPVNNFIQVLNLHNFCFNSSFFDFLFDNFSNLLTLRTRGPQNYSRLPSTNLDTHSAGIIPALVYTGFSQEVWDIKPDTLVVFFSIISSLVSWARALATLVLASYNSLLLILLTLFLLHYYYIAILKYSIKLCFNYSSNNISILPFILPFYCLKLVVIKSFLC